MRTIVFGQKTVPSADREGVLGYPPLDPADFEKVAFGAPETVEVSVFWGQFLGDTFWGCLLGIMQGVWSVPTAKELTEVGVGGGTGRSGQSLCLRESGKVSIAGGLSWFWGGQRGCRDGLPESARRVKLELPVPFLEAPPRQFFDAQPGNTGPSRGCCDLAHITHHGVRGGMGQQLGLQGRQGPSR